MRNREVLTPSTPPEKPWRALWLATFGGDGVTLRRLTLHREVHEAVVAAAGGAPLREWLATHAHRWTAQRWAVYNNEWHCANHAHEYLP